MERRARSKYVLGTTRRWHCPTADPAPKAATFPICCYWTFDLPIPMFPTSTPASHVFAKNFIIPRRSRSSYKLCNQRSYQHFWLEREIILRQYY